MLGETTITFLMTNPSSTKQTLRSRIMWDNNRMLGTVTLSDSLVGKLAI